MFSEIVLTQGLCVKVSRSDVHRLSGYKWHAFGGKIKSAATCIWIPEEKKRKTILMHRLLMSAPPNMVVDHINGDALDNRRENLRLATAKQNSRNKRHSSIHGFLGVRKSRDKWTAAIFPDGVAITLGTYASKELSAAAYNAAAEILFGEFARLNDVPKIDGIREQIIAEKESAINRIRQEIAYLKGERNAS